MPKTAIEWADKIASTLSNEELHSLTGIDHDEFWDHLSSLDMRRNREKYGYPKDFKFNGE